MRANLLLGGLVTAICMALECVTVVILLQALSALEKSRSNKTSLFTASVVLIGVMLVLVAGNLLQMTIWALLYFSLAEFTGFAAAFYHSAVNFTTLGYGDLVMSEEHRLLGPLEATNGVLMFGLTTAFLFAVLSILIRRVWAERGSERSQED